MLYLVHYSQYGLDLTEYCKPIQTTQQYWVVLPVQQHYSPLPKTQQTVVQPQYIHYQRHHTIVFMLTTIFEVVLYLEQEIYLPFGVEVA